MAVWQPGDEQDWTLEEVYDRYSTLAFTLALRVVGDVCAAEDVVQEAFVSIWLCRESFDERRGSMRSWICRVVRNRAIDRTRRRARQVRWNRQLDDQLTLTAAEVADMAVQADEAATIRCALNELSSAHRQLIELAYFDGYSQSEISRAMGMPLGTVKTRTRAALRALHGTISAAMPERVSPRLSTRTSRMV